MLTPPEPAPAPIQAISPSLYEALLLCPARATWYANGSRSILPTHPSALLGTCFHAVMEALQRGIAHGDEDECREGARRAFDELAARIHGEAQPLLRVKFPSPARIPYYNLIRERAAAAAAEYCRTVQHPGERSRSSVAEARFESSDHVIVGRPDLIDPEHSEVIDYKTGQPHDDGWQVSEREGRQLRLYAYLAAESGIEVTKGTIIRSNGETGSIQIPEKDAQAEAESARRLLAEFNASVESGISFRDAAIPSPTACRMCPCIPLCEAFWDAADSGWREECGVHVEGTVSSIHPAEVQGTALLTITVDASRGTLDEGEASIEQIPQGWVLADGDRCPERADAVRLVDGRLVSEDPAVVRADRVTTSLWRLESVQ